MEESPALRLSFDQEGVRVSSGYGGGSTRDLGRPRHCQTLLGKTLSPAKLHTVRERWEVGRYLRGLRGRSFGYRLGLARTFFASGSDTLSIFSVYLLCIFSRALHHGKCLSALEPLKYPRPQCGTTDYLNHDFPGAKQDTKTDWSKGRRK